jgi:heterodisulfide reductase subunit B
MDVKPYSAKVNWCDFNKEIATDNYYYLRSCIRQNFFPGSETTFLDILRNKLGRNIVDDPMHTTCAGIGYHTDIVPFDTIQTIAARHFALMTEQGIKNAAVSCVTSFGIYSEIIDTWKHFPNEEKKARQSLKKATGREFELPENIVHSSDIIYKFRDEIAKQSKYKLINQQTGQALKIVDHIGCHYSKMFPERGVGGAEYPKVLSGLVQAWGGQTVDYPERRHCCGFGFRNYFIKSTRSYCMSNSKKKFESMAPYQPDAIITNCPGCNLFLDRWQYSIEQIEGKTYGHNGEGIPVLTYEELAGLVLGYDPWKLGLQMHQTNAEPFLDKMGIEYRKADKHLDINGKLIGEPAIKAALIH